jgi:hypothetical protein
VFYTTPDQGIGGKMKNQITSNILMIRPINFNFNEETAANNYYQKVIENLTPEKAQEQALREFDAFVLKLRTHGINIIVIEDTPEPYTPDSVFPNNWISFHEDGLVGLYPMFAPSRRGERRPDILNQLALNFEVFDIIDFTEFEANSQYLEGTGSMVLDRANKIVYAALSDRTHATVLEEFCEKFDYTLISFIANQTVEGHRVPIYHTNVMMCVAEEFAIICAESLDNEVEKERVFDSLIKTGKEIIEISEEQVNRFAGNMLQVRDKEGNKYLIMSTSAYQSLEIDQIKKIENHCPIIHSSLDMIEACGGGSARCMMAEVFLQPKQTI